MTESKLTIAVPRGSLFKEALDCLDRAGIDTTPVRENDRRLHFPEVGIVTVRPTDVPTYVDCGAADLGITGKDVIGEQLDRDFIELLDLEFGGCKMVVATIDVDTTVLTPVDEPQLEARLLERIWNGRIRFDVAAGRLVGRTTAIDRRVVGFGGPQSSVRYKASLEETAAP